MYRCWFIVKYAVIYSDAKINTFTTMDAIYAFKIQGRTFYGLMDEIFLNFFPPFTIHI